MNELIKNNLPPLEDELAAHNDAILELVMKASDHAAVPTEILEHLKIVRTRSLYRADKDGDGQANFETFEEYIAWLVDEARERLRAKKDHGLKTGYKLINEAVVVGRLIEQGATKIPRRRAQTQVIEDCPLEIQARVWDRALQIAVGRKVLTEHVKQAARENGVEIPDSKPSASSKLGKLRASWQVLALKLRPSVGPDLILEFDTFHAEMSGKSTKSDKHPSQAGPAESPRPDESYDTAVIASSVGASVESAVSVEGSTITPEKVAPSVPPDPFADIPADQVPAAVRTDKYIFVKFDGRGQYLSFSAGRPAPALGVGYRWDGERGVWQLSVSGDAAAEIAMSNISALLGNWKAKFCARQAG